MDRAILEKSSDYPETTGSGLVKPAIGSLNFSSYALPMVLGSVLGFSAGTASMSSLMTVLELLPSPYGTCQLRDVRGHLLKAKNGLF